MVARPIACRAMRAKPEGPAQPRQGSSEPLGASDPQFRIPGAEVEARCMDGKGVGIRMLVSGKRPV